MLALTLNISFFKIYLLVVVKLIYFIIAFIMFVLCTSNKPFSMIVSVNTVFK